MLTIIHNETYYTLPYDPCQTLQDLKHAVARLTHIGLKSLILLYNNVPLTDDHLQIHKLVPDDTTLHTAILSPSSVPTQNLESIVEMFPELKTQMEKNKQLKEFVASGNLQDEFDKMAKNPKYMNEQLRSIDLAMSKLENIPGGLNMMSSMVNEVSEPLNEIFTKKGKNVKEGVRIEDVNVQRVGANKENLKLRYAVQLQELKSLGFADAGRNLAVLRTCDGDLENAICILAEENEEFIIKQ